MRNRLRHDPVGSIRQLIDAPKLLGTAREVCDSDDFITFRRCQGALRIGDLNLEVRGARVTASIGNSSYGPLLVGPHHVIADAQVNIARRPIR